MRAALQAATAMWFERLTHSRRSWQVLAEGSRSGNRILAFCPSGYLGVAESTRRFFPDRFTLNEVDLVLPSDRRAFVEALVETNPDAVVFSGFCAGYKNVLERFRVARAATPIYVLWHASPLQLRERNDRRHFDAILDLARRGVVTRIGCFKTGEGRALTKLGIDAMDVFNPPPEGVGRNDPRERGECETSATSKIRVGIFSAGESWRKNPYAMIAATGRLASAEVSGVLDRSAQRYARDLGIEVGRLEERAFGRRALEDLARQQDVNLYVSLSECSPLFPLESLHWGVPCVIGATSHLFSDSPVLCVGNEVTPSQVSEAAELLERTLVVTRLDDPSAIAHKIEESIATREAVLEAYRTWCEPYRAAALASMESLLSVSLSNEIPR